MKMSEAFPSKYLKADVDVPDEGSIMFTIANVQMETLGQGQDADDKPVVYFEESEKGLVLNKTNGNTLVSLYGDDSDDWTGKRVNLFSTDVDFGGKATRAIRVSSKKPADKPKATNGKPAPKPVTAKEEADDEMMAEAIVAKPPF